MHILKSRIYFWGYAMKTNKKQMVRISLVTLCTAVMILAAASALAAPNISGRWVSNHGHVYNIMQMGDFFTWRMPDTGQTGVGDIDDASISAAHSVTGSTRITRLVFVFIAHPLINFL